MPVTTLCVAGRQIYETVVTELKQIQARGQHFPPVKTRRIVRAELRRRLLARAPRHKAVLELAAEKAGWGKPLSSDRHRGVALAESFGCRGMRVDRAEDLRGALEEALQSDVPVVLVMPIDPSR